MTLYTLDGVAPNTPEDGDFWVAPNAQVMGKVTIEAGVGITVAAVMIRIFYAIASRRLAR